MRNLIQLSVIFFSLFTLNVQATAITDSTKQFETKVLSHIDLMNTHTSILMNLSCDTQKDKLVKNWKIAYSHYLAISYMDLEVITKNSLNYSFSFWPDKKNLIAQKMRLLLSETFFTDAYIDNSSAPVKGYQAIEYL